MSCDICESEFCDGERCSENGSRDPYVEPDLGPGDDDDDEEEEDEEEEEEDPDALQL
jgi:hypothetical protein